MVPRTGRPTNDPKSIQYRIRLSESDLEKLDYCSKATGKTKAEIIREGIGRIYQELQSK
jgi:predicted DNA-binding protein